MDEYAEYLYLRRPSYRDIDPGDLSAQKKIREKLKCKSFKWFMENIAFDLAKHYPPIEPPDYASGEVCTEFSCFNILYHVSYLSIQSPLKGIVQSAVVCLLWSLNLKLCELSLC